MGLSGTGQWKTHRCSDGLVDQADGLPNNRSGPGTGELSLLYDQPQDLVFPSDCQVNLKRTLK